jgi:peptide/nickel transport system substrate-binding protein
VKFSFDLIKDPKSATSLTASMASIDSMTVRDSLTAVAWFSRRSPEQFYNAVFHMHVMPAHVLKDVAADKLETVEVNTKLIGSGRFRLARFNPGTRVELIADTANYRGRARLDRVIWTFAPDGGAAITQLFAGQADMVEIVPPEVAARADSSTTVKALRYPALTYAYMGMNNRDPRRPGAPHPVFGDRRVRRAISMGMDREAMLRNVFDTLGTLGSGPYPRALADTSVKPLPFDRGRAAAELDSAGWRMGPDSVRTKGGRPLAFSLLAPTSSSQRMRYAVLIQEQLKPLGIRVNVESMDFQAYSDRINRRNFDALLNLWAPDPSIGGVREVWASENIRPGGQNVVSYSNRAFDALLDSVAMTFDPARSREYRRRAYEVILNDAPAVFLYDGLTIAAMHRRLRPVDIRPTAWWYGLADWSIPGNERIDRDRIGLRPAQP